MNGGVGCFAERISLAVEHKNSSHDEECEENERAKSHFVSVRVTLFYRNFKEWTGFEKRICEREKKWS